MNRGSRLSRSILLVALLAGTAPQASPAQEGTGKQPGAPAKTLISLDFPGGTASEYVAAIRGAGPDANIVLTSEDVRALRLPAVQLRAVDPSSAAQVLSGDYPAADGNLLIVRVQELRGGADDARPVYKVAAELVNRRPRADVAVWSLVGLISPDLPSESILTAVEASLALVMDDPPARVRFHEGTALLLISGTPAQREAVDQVVRSLRQGAAFRRGREARGGRAEGASEPKTALADGDDSASGNGRPGAADLEGLTARLGELERLLSEKERRIRELERRAGAKAGE